MATEENKKIALFLKQHKSTPNIEDKPFHPSALVNGNRNGSLINNLASNYLDDIVFINDYHFYCRLCQHHFYSCSKFNDTNSYFQPHINTVNHVWNINNSKYDFNKDIFIWEKWLYSAFCNVCQVANVTAFIIDTKLKLRNILQDHLKGFNHTDKYKVAYDKPWNRIFPTLDLVWTRHIYTTPNGTTECRLCFESMKTTGLFEYHLTSASHALKLETLLKEKLGVLTDSVTEDQVRQLVKWMSEQPQCQASPNSQKLHKYKEQKVNNEEQFKNLSMERLGFYPSQVEELLTENANDMIDGNFCLLCKESATSISHHMAQNSHKLRWVVFERCASVTPFTNPVYIKNRNERLKPFKNEIRLYYKYKLYLQKHNLDFGIPYKPEYLQLEEKVDESINTSLLDEKFHVSDVLLQEEGKKEEVKKKSNLKGSGNNVHKTRRDSNEQKSDKKKEQKPQTGTEVIRVMKVDLAKLFEVQMESFVSNVWPISDTIGYCEDCKENVNLKDISDHVLLMKHKAKEGKKSSILGYLKDPNFSKFIEQWKLRDLTFYVCIACASVMYTQNTIFHHIICAKHVTNFEMQFKKDLKFINISNFSMNYQSQFWVCNVCHENVKELTEPEWNGKYFASCVRCIKKHLCNCKGNPETALTETKAAKPKKLANSYPEKNKESFKNSKTTGSEQGSPVLLNRQQRKQKIIVRAETRKKELDNTIVKLTKKHENEITSFLCMPCLQSDSKEHLEDHLKSQNHVKNESFFISDMAVYCHYCKICKMLLLGNHGMLNQHFNSTYHSNEQFCLSGERVIPKPEAPIITNVLLVKGSMDKNIVKTLLKDFKKFGDLKWLRVKKNYMKICFKDLKAVTNVMKNEKIFSENYGIKLSARKFTVEDDSLGLKPTMIYLLGHYEDLMSYVSTLVDTAFQINNSLQERAKEEMVCESLKKCVSPVYPFVEFHIFGSRRTGLTLKNSDLDVFVDCGGYYLGNLNQGPAKQAQIVGTVCQELKKSVEFKSIKGIGKCRVPIVTCCHKPTNMNCDLSFKNGLSCQNTKLIRFMIKLDNRVTPLILFLKDWVKINGLYGRPKFSSYAVVMLVFYYLQQEPNPILPSVELLQKKYKGPPKIIGGWNCGFTTNEEDVPKTNNTDSFAQLLLGFFNFWADFEFAEYVVSPLVGKPLNRNSFRLMELDGLPSPYDSYSNDINPDNYCMGNSPICVMDPFDLDHNLTKSFPEKSLQKFIYLSRVSAGLLSNALQSKYFAHVY